MARISTYGQDSTLNKLDKVLGTDSATGGTKNYTINSIMGLINDEGLVQAFDGSTFKFQSYVAGSSDPQGVINLNAGAASTAAFSAINQIYISTKDSTGLSLNEYLENADNDFIKISKKGNLNQFGIFEVTDIADHDGGTYKLLTLTPRGTNGNLVVNDDYFVSNYSALYDMDFSDDSVTEFGDVTDAGSGAIITSAERTSLNNFTANGLVHGDVVDNVTTTDTTLPLSANQGKVLKDALDAKISADGSVTTHSDVTNAGSGLIITSTERTTLGTALQPTDTLAANNYLATKYDLTQIPSASGGYIGDAQTHQMGGILDGEGFQIQDIGLLDMRATANGATSWQFQPTGSNLNLSTSGKIYTFTPTSIDVNSSHINNASTVNFDDPNATSTNWSMRTELSGAAAYDNDMIFYNPASVNFNAIPRDGNITLGNHLIDLDYFNANSSSNAYSWSDSIAVSNVNMNNKQLNNTQWLKFSNGGLNTGFAMYNETAGLRVDKGTSIFRFRDDDTGVTSGRDIAVLDDIAKTGTVNTSSTYTATAATKIHHLEVGTTQCIIDYASFEESDYIEIWNNSSSSVIYYPSTASVRINGAFVNVGTTGTLGGGESLRIHLPVDGSNLYGTK